MLIELQRRQKTFAQLRLFDIKELYVCSIAIMVRPKL